MEKVRKHENIMADGLEFEWAEDFESVSECFKRAEGWILRGYAVIIIPMDDRIALYVSKKRVCYKKRMEYGVINIYAFL